MCTLTVLSNGLAAVWKQIHFRSCVTAKEVKRLITHQEGHNTASGRQQILGPTFPFLEKK